jgi:hypothetical protein
LKKNGLYRTFGFPPEGALYGQKNESQHLMRVSLIIVRPIKRDDRSGGAEMEVVQVKQVITKDGEVLLTGLPFKKGQSVEIIVFPESTTPVPLARLTVGRLRQSGLIGLWQDRNDIGDSSAYARRLREQAQQRGDPRL